MSAAVYLVRGDDPALIDQAAEHLIEELVGDDDPVLVVEEINVELAGTDAVAAILDACLTPPFLSAQRIVVVRNTGGLDAEASGRLVAYLADPLPTTHLVLVAGGGSVNQKLAAAAKQAGEIVDAGVPTGKGRTTWLTARLRDAPVTFDAAAGARIGEHLGEDLGRLAGIIDALTTAYGEGAKVGVAEVEPFLGEAGGVAPWDLTDAIDKGDTEAALGHLHRMMAAGERHPLVIMSTLHRHFAAMLRIDGSGVRNEQEAAELLGLRSTFPARKAMSQAGKLGPAGIRKAVALIADGDIDLRGASAWPDELVLEVLVARLCRLAPTRPPARTATRGRR